jgi:hypothetical protein
MAGRFDEVLRHRGCKPVISPLTIDLDPKLEEFSVDARCAPQWVGDAGCAVRPTVGWRRSCPERADEYRVASAAGHREVLT